MDAPKSFTNEPQPEKQSWLKKIQSKFAVPPAPKTLKEALKRDYVLVGGTLVTLGFLSTGVYNHVRGGNQVTTNKLLRGRIYAQALTVGIMCFYAFSYKSSLDEEEQRKKNQKVVLT